MTSRRRQPSLYWRFRATRAIRTATIINRTCSASPSRRRLPAATPVRQPPAQLCRLSFKPAFAKRRLPVATSVRQPPAQPCSRSFKPAFAKRNSPGQQHTAKRKGPDRRVRAFPFLSGCPVASNRAGMKAGARGCGTASGGRGARPGRSRSPHPATRNECGWRRSVCCQTPR